MSLQLIIQNEVCQKEKDKYRILTYINGIQKNGIDGSICREGMETQTQRTDLWTQLEKEKLEQESGSIDIQHRHIAQTLDLPGGLGSKESASSTEELGSIPVMGITMYKIGSW